MDWFYEENETRIGKNICEALKSRRGKLQSPIQLSEQYTNKSKSLNLRYHFLNLKTQPCHFFYRM